MTEMKKRVIGALIGIARATDGNEHLITVETNATLIECLRAEPENEEQVQVLLKRIEDTKRNMVPDCFLCANPCGKNSGFDLHELNREKPDVRDLKHALLQSVCRYAAADNCDERIIYMTLVVIGIEDYSAETMKHLLAQMTTI